MSNDEQESKVLSILRMITSPISIIASATLIVIIARSNNRFSTTQNRLVTGLSVADIIASLAMSLNTLPMPVDTPLSWLSVGNVTTCEVQGFFFTLGSMMAPTYNAALCIFYVVKVRYNLNDETVKRKVEPFLHLFPISIGTFPAVSGLVKDYFNPTVGVCYFQEYPHNCSNKADVPCERGEGVFKSFTFRITAFVAFVVVPAVIITTMWLLYASAKQQEKRMARFGRGSLNLAESTRESSSTQQPTNARKTMHRGLAYSGAWLVTFFFPAIMFVSLLFRRPVSYALRILVAIFHPLQGFFNFLVYIYPKVGIIRGLNPSLSVFEAFRRALRPGERAHDLTRVLTPHERKGNDSMVVRDVQNMQDVEVGQ